MLVSPYQVQNDSSDFLNLSGRYTTDEDGWMCIGRHNTQNKLHGEAIHITASGNIYLQTFNQGLDAPGNFIYIETGGMF
jgi:hypothetical protein